MTFTWTAPDPLNNKAKTRSIYITELQAAINVKRAEISLAPITFIDQSVGKKFRLDAIEELKTVTNDLAILYGYPTGVEDPCLLGRPYVTITKKYGKYVCHYPILNDLRLVLNTLVVQAGLIFGYVLEHPVLGFDNIANLSIGSGPFDIKYQFKPEFVGVSNGLGCDNAYLYRLYVTPTASTIVYKDNINTGINDIIKSISPWQATDICVDENYVWLVGYVYIGPGNFNWQIKKLLKSNLTILSTHTILNQTNGGYWTITNDKNSLYITGVDLVNIAEIRKYNKSDFSYLAYPVDGHFTADVNRLTVIYDMSIDTNYIYVTYYEENIPILPPLERISAILQLNKSSMSINQVIDGSTLALNPRPFNNCALTVSDNYIYVIPRHIPAGVYKAVIYDKSGVELYNTLGIDGQGFKTTNTVRHLACNIEEYRVAIV